MPEEEGQQQRYCRTCGAETRSRDSFCVSCGVRLDSQTRGTEAREELPRTTDELPPASTESPKSPGPSNNDHWADVVNNNPDQKGSIALGMALMVMVVAGLFSIDGVVEVIVGILAVAVIVGILAVAVRIWVSAVGEVNRREAKRRGGRPGMDGYDKFNEDWETSVITMSVFVGAVVILVVVFLSILGLISWLS